jgi:predicted transcriptional regulator with HTH domain
MDFSYLTAVPFIDTFTSSTKQNTMENISVLEKGANFNKLTRENFNEKLLLHERSFTNPVVDKIILEGGDDLFKYLTWTGLSKEPNLMVLSSMHHYYYDHKDMAGIKTLINLKKLNQVKHLESFLYTLFRILPSRAYFVGCFSNSSHRRKGPSFYSSARFFTGLKNIFDSRSERALTKKGVTQLMEEHGFKIIDITDLNRITYFWAQNLRKTCE